MPLTEAGVLAWCLPLLALAGLLPALFRARTARAWALAEAACALAIPLALAAAVSGALGGARFDAVGHALGILIAILGWVVARYSRRYLTGERGQRRYIAALLATLAASHAVVLADHLGVLVAAWVATSLTLHVLLTFYGERSAARIAAHKKFFASRLAELCLLGALLLTWQGAGTLSIAAIAALLAGGAPVGPALHAAAVLFALAAIIQCAQLPLHGWLIQVMEAPTPVSALLHAGVVNLGGVVLIRLAPLLAEAPLAQGLLVLAGGATAVLAGLVMMTRISIKVRLAWSTAAQMGFMLLQCGLGLYALALLHLLAHSAYKAYAFLSAGDTVLAARRAALAPAAPLVAPGHRAAWRIASVPLALALVAAAAWFAQAAAGLGTPQGIVLWIVGLGLAPLLWQAEGRGPAALARGVAAVGALSLLYLGWHALAGTAVASPPHPHAATFGVAAGAMILALYAVQAWVLAFPRGALSRWLHPHAYAGFHLDESFTRATFRLWPAPPPAIARPQVLATGDAA
jgi:NAD(P)H-quinone oxidoreductase subunit 5